MPSKPSLAAVSASLLVTSLACLTACGGPDPKMVAHKDDGVPANSASEERMKNGGEKKEEKTEAPRDPTQPYTQPVVGGDPSGGGTTAGKDGKGGAAASKDGKDPKAGKEAKGGKDKVAKADCTRALDKFLDLMIASDSRFEGIPPEMVAQFKQQGFSQVSGPNPCDGEGITRTQYNCAMAAGSTSAWQRCMK